MTASWSSARRLIWIKRTRTCGCRPLRARPPAFAAPAAPPAAAAAAPPAGRSPGKPSPGKPAARQTSQPRQSRQGAFVNCHLGSGAKGLLSIISCGVSQQGKGGHTRKDVVDGVVGLRWRHRRRLRSVLHGLRLLQGELHSSGGRVGHHAVGHHHGHHRRQDSRVARLRLLSVWPRRRLDLYAKSMSITLGLHSCS